MNNPSLLIGFRLLALFEGVDGDELELKQWSREEEIGNMPVADDLSGVTMNYSLLKFSIAYNFLEKQNGRAWLTYQ